MKDSVEHAVLNLYLMTVLITHRVVHDTTFPRLAINPLYANHSANCVNVSNT